MKKKIYFPFYFQTKPLFIDDDKGFLSVIEQLCDCETSTDPFAMANKLSRQYIDITEILNQSFVQTLALNNAELTSISEDVSYQDMDVAFLSGRLSKQLDFNKLKETVSGVFVDYDMGEYNGLDFCRKISDIPIKKALLTGVADERIAIEAVNERLIDYYIRKDDPNLDQKIMQYCEEFEKDFLDGLTSAFEPWKSKDHISLLNSEAFCQFISDFIEKNNIYGYFFHDQPFGYTFESDKKLFHMILQNDELKKASYEISHDHENQAHRYGEAGSLEEYLLTEFSATDIAMLTKKIGKQHGELIPGEPKWAYLLHEVDK